MQFVNELVVVQIEYMQIVQVFLLNVLVEECLFLVFFFYMNFILVVYNSFGLVFVGVFEQVWYIVMSDLFGFYVRRLLYLLNLCLINNIFLCILFDKICFVQCYIFLKIIRCR